jgi:hypothetical protein
MVVSFNGGGKQSTWRKPLTYCQVYTFQKSEISEFWHLVDPFLK